MVSAWFADVQMGGQTLNFIMDTGAEVTTAVTHSTYQQLSLTAPTNSCHSQHLPTAVSDKALAQSPPLNTRAEQLWIFQHHDYCIHTITIIDYITIMPLEGDLQTHSKSHKAMVDRSHGGQCLCIHSPDYCPTKYIHENP